ncbi:MAG: hypothetical protein JWM31_2485, partial [Solirubrobacterales bacterium]|nr:hypothetical protein [Solirubrobacterales bacterium]
MAEAWQDQRTLRHADDAVSAGRSAEARRRAGSVSGDLVDAPAARISAVAALQQGDLRTAERDVARALL